MNMVLDASMALAWIFERQNKKENICSQKALTVMSESETLVPALWHTEMANALLVGERRKVISEAQVIDYLNKLSKLPITTDEIAISDRREIIMALAREYELTAYDATYLDLALRTNAALATFDNKLITAMEKAGGRIFN